MAKINSEWIAFKAPVSAANGWLEMKSWLGDLRAELPEKSVYVIRTARPFSIAYKKASPVLYIGEGNFRTRFRSHMKKWVADLGKYLPNLEIEVRYCRIAVPGNGAAHRDVEADLIWKFGEVYGSTPMLNRQYEYHDRMHIYRDGFFNVLSPGKGRGYQWALTPLASNLNYPQFIKGQF